MTAALPPVCINKETVKNNEFSKHDNRHMIENDGIYLGTGLGRKQCLDPQKNQHWSDSQNFVHVSAGPGSQQKYISTYSSGYKLRSLHERSSKDRCSSASVTAPTHDHSAIKRSKKAMRRCFSSTVEIREPPSHSAVKVRYNLDRSHARTISMTKSNLRRFPHKYSLPKDMESARPSINAVWWYRNQGPVESETSFVGEGVPRTSTFTGPPRTCAGGNGGNGGRSCTTSLGVLAATQQPLHKNNSWKY